MIYHIFPANIYHLSPQLIKSIVVKTPNKHSFLLIGQSNKQTNWSIYKNIFNELCYDNFEFFDNNSSFEKENNLDRNSFIILHSDSYDWKFYFFRNRFKNVHWICWGSGIDVKLNFRSIISYFYKILLYSKLRSIIVLSEEDKKKLQTFFLVKNIEMISYFESVNDLYTFKKSNFKSENQEDVSVFLGNNSTAISTYRPLLKTLQRFSNNITITAMLNYDLIKNDVYKDLINFGSSVYGNRFRSEEKLYDLKDYPSYINQCDIYVCSVEEQTGLGAIYTALKLGKKIYLKGNNFNYIKSLGFNIFHINELYFIDYEEFRKPLSLEIQYFNYDLIMNFLSDDKLIKNWNFFYKKHAIL